MAVYDLKMADGSIEKVSLSMAALFNLQRQDPELYQRYKQLYGVIGSGAVDELVMAETLYIAYRAANQGSDTMEYVAFLERLTDSRAYLAEAFSMLFGEVEKKQGFVPPSGKRHGKNSGHR